MEKWLSLHKIAAGMATPYLYTGLNDFLSKHFDRKVQKISLNAGFTCPNRDGTVGRGGCTYCNNHTFNPDYCSTGKSIREQLEEGKRFFTRKYPDMLYLAYFQAYTNTYADIERLKSLYEEALSVEKVVGLVVGTRPDCVSDELLDYFERLSRRTFVWLEYGIESTSDRTLERINRGHDFATTCRAIEATAARGIAVGGHVILGLPGESREGILRQAADVSALPLDTLKMHQLQVIRGTRMEEEWKNRPEDFFVATADDYIALVVDYLQRLRPTLAVERFVSQSPKQLLLSPDWGLKNYEFVEKLRRRMMELGVWQGKMYEAN